MTLHIPERAIQRRIKGKLLVSLNCDGFKDYPEGSELELFEVQFVVPPTGNGPISTHIEYWHPVKNDLYWMPSEVEVLEDLGPYVKETN